MNTYTYVYTHTYILTQVLYLLVHSFVSFGFVLMFVIIVII